jgi:hypothetical protein
VLPSNDFTPEHESEPIADRMHCAVRTVRPGGNVVAEGSDRGAEWKIGALKRGIRRDKASIRSTVRRVYTRTNLVFGERCSKTKEGV